MENDFRKLYQQFSQPSSSQCMHRRGAGIRCTNEAVFTLGFPNGEAQDVCKDCLPIICERYDEVLVMKFKPRSTHPEWINF